MNEIEKQAVEEMYQEFLQYKHDTMCKVFSYKGMCENFINLGYRKIDEEEYNKLKNLEKYHITCEDVNEYVSAARQETAEKIFKKLEYYYHFMSDTIVIPKKLFNELAKQYGVEVK